MRHFVLWSLFPSFTCLIKFDIILKQHANTVPIFHNDQMQRLYLKAYRAALNPTQSMLPKESKKKNQHREEKWILFSFPMKTVCVPPTHFNTFQILSTKHSWAKRGQEHRRNKKKTTHKYYEVTIKDICLIKHVNNVEVWSLPCWVLQSVSMLSPVTLLRSVRRMSREYWRSWLWLARSLLAAQHRVLLESNVTAGSGRAVSRFIVWRLP